MFYTDTNGQVPQKRHLALVLLESAMETLPTYELGIENFNELVKDLDLISSDLNNEAKKIQIRRLKNRKKAQ